MGQNTVKNKAEQAPLVVLEPATAAGIKLFKLFTIPPPVTFAHPLINFFLLRLLISLT